MRKHLLTLLVLLLVSTVAQATVTFESGKKYRFTCNQFGAGSIALGSNHGSTALVYYYAESNVPDDGWWYVEENNDGYTLRNAQSGQYLYYEGTREEGVAKGLRLTTDKNTETMYWTFEATDNGFCIANTKNPEQRFNIRTDGTNLIGTYATYGSPTGNEIFVIYDEDGKEVTDDGNTGGNTGETGGEQGTSGIDAAGNYWETTGLEMPVVLTTDKSNPVYYYIQNIRKGNYLYAGNNRLLQTAELSNASRFYFVQDNAGVHIIASNGPYVSTYTWGTSGGSLVNTYNGSPSTGSDAWSFGYYGKDEYPGYTVKATTDWYSSDECYWNDYNGTSICFYSVDNGSTFRFLSNDERHLEYLADQDILFDGKPIDRPKTFSSLVDSVRFDQKDLVYRKDTKSYMFNVRPKYRNGLTYTPNVEVRFKQADAGYELRIDSVALTAAGTIDFPKISGLDTHQLQVWLDGTVVATANLNFTFLPIVEINVPSVSSSYYTTGSIRVNYFQDAGYDSTYIAAFKYRGASAQNYPKKSYAVKLRDENGNSVDREFLGFRNDNNWILDAMAVDRACMRNRVSTDLWNDFSHAPYHKKNEAKARSGTRGKFVEVLLNGNYHGIYCMTEKMDRKQLRLKKSADKSLTNPADTIHGALYKSSQWTYEVFFGHEMIDYGISYEFPNRAPASYDNTKKQETWQAYEIKYPDYEEQAIDWGPLWDGINFVATSDDTRFAGWFQEYFDYPVLVDYYLFIELILATDNHGKNMFHYIYDTKASRDNKKLGIAVWDLDGTWGRRWDGTSSLTRADQDFPTFLDENEHGQLSYYYRLNQIASFNWTDVLKARYAELRGTYFDEDALVERFEEYMDIFSKSGADVREQDRWKSALSSHKDLQADVDFIKEWIHDRLSYLDCQYDYTIPDGVNRVTDKKYVGATGGKGCIEFHIFEPQTVNIYNVSGQLVRTVSLTKGMTKVGGLQPGVYVAGGTKVIVR